MTDQRGATSGVEALAKTVPALGVWGILMTCVMFLVKTIKLDKSNEAFE